MKEKLVVEIFKDKIREHYNKTIRTGVQCNCKSINVFSEIKEYCDKVGANYNIVQQLCYDIKEEMYREHYNRYHAQTFNKGSLDSKRIAHKNMISRINAYSKRIIKRNGGVV